MILETLFSGLGTSAVEKLINLARQRNDARLRAMIQEELTKFARDSSNSIIVNIHIGDLVQQIHVLSESGLSSSAIIEASRSHSLPALLSANEMVSGFATAIRSRLGSPLSLVGDATPSELGTTGLVQRFEGGKDDPVRASVYKSRYGAYPTWGWIARCYEELGGTGSRLGFPISSEIPARSPQEASGQVQRFEGNGDGVSFLDGSSLTGVSIYCSPRGAYATWGEIGRCYERLGGTGSRLGFPVSPEQETHPSSQERIVWRQHFEGGEISCEWGSDPVVHN